MKDKNSFPNERDEAIPALPIDLVKHYSAKRQLNQAIAGGVAGCCTRFLTQPFDVLKIRFQLQVEPVGTVGKEQTAVKSKYTSVGQATRLILAEEGVRAFWKGHNAGQVISITYAIFQFWSYEQIQLSVSQLPWLDRHQRISHFISGGLAGAFATIIITPFDVVRTRLVAQDHGSGYKNIPHALAVLWRQEGMYGMCRGLGATLIQIGPLVGGNFLIYNALNDFAKTMLDSKNEKLPTWCLLLNGGMAGTASKALIYPLDLIKKRLQVQGFAEHRKSFGRHQTCTGIMNCARITLRDEGVMGFYKGMIPTLFKSGLTTAFYFSIYDEIKTILFRRSQEREQT